MLMPGDVIYVVDNADDSVVTVQVLAPKMTVLGLLSVLLVKLGGKKEIGQ